MCTAAVYTTKSGYFGRTLDYEFSYGEEVADMPRRYALHFRHAGALTEHYAILGMAHMAGGYPLYYDAMNEKGLGMAGLNFVGNAAYTKPVPAGGSWLPGSRKAPRPCRPSAIKSFWTCWTDGRNFPRRLPRCSSPPGATPSGS